MPWSINPEYKKIENNPIVATHDTATTQATIKELLKDGTPDWFSHPEDYKQYAKESAAYDYETSCNMVAEYRMEDQEQLIDFKARNVNIIGSKEFVLKLRDNGIRCAAVYNGMAGTAGLWSIVPTKTGMNVRYVTFIQIPAMIEWDVLHLDPHGLPDGLEYRGWRSVVVELVKRQVITERRATEIFGRPTDSIVSRRYRRSLFEFRHRHKDVEILDGF